MYCRILFATRKDSCGSGGIGKKNLNKMNTRIFLLILIASTILYFLPELLFDEAMLYISGGIIGGSILEVLKYFGIENKDFLVTLIWFFLLIGVTLVFLKLKNKPIKYFLVVVIVFLLYVFDFLFFEIPNNITNYHLLKWARILSKSLILSIIIYYGFYGKRKEVKTTE